MILIAEDMHPALMEGLKERNISFAYTPDITLEELHKLIPSCTGLVIRSRFYADKNLIDDAKNLKFIARAGSGMDNVDEEYAESKDITLLSAPEGLCDTVAEHVIGMILALQHKIVQSNNEVKNHVWQRAPNRGRELMGSTVGIIGYGHTGSAVARKLKGFGLNVIAYDKYKENFSDDYATSCNLATIYEHSDILTLHIPLTTETLGWINETFFEQFKKPIVLINSSRGKILNTGDLVKAIKNKKVLAAALDVLEKEPPFSKEKSEEENWFTSLCTMPEVILTPHIAGWSYQSYERISVVLLQKLKSFLNK